MATKSTSSVKTTTNLQTGSTQSFRTSYKTKSSSNIGKGGLTSLGRMGTIAITILFISVGSSLTDFTTTDIITTTPNYEIHNDYVSIVDPLDNINYIRYGDQVVDRLLTFVNFFADVGGVVKFYWDSLVGLDLSEVLPLNALMNFNKFNSLADAQATWDSLLPAQQNTYSIYWDDYLFVLSWFYYSPTQLSA